MPQLEDLAHEILLDILYHIPPEDLDSVSLVSKRIHQASQPLLDQHRKVLEEQYRVWDRYLLKESYPSHEHTDTHADLLCTVATDQRLAKMVQTLRVRNDTWLDQKFIRGDWRPDEDFSGALPFLRKSRRPPAERSRIQLLEEMVRQNDMVPEMEKGAWIIVLRAGSEMTAGLLLLCKLPALQSFQIDLSAASSLAPHHLLTMLNRIINRLTFPLQGAIPLAQPCQNLKHIMITFSKSKFTHIDLVISFLSLPSISSLSCSSLVMKPDDFLEIQEPMLGPSAIKHLRFSDCVLEPEAFAEILPFATNLENFTYAYYLSGGSALLANAEFGYPVPNGHQALPTIASTIGSSIETLVLSARTDVVDFGRWGKIRQIDISQSFRALKRLSVSTNLLLSEEEGDISKMAGKLPMSLECLVLHWIKRAPIKDINALKGVLDDFTEQAAAQLPSLEHLAVRERFTSKDRRTLCPAPEYKMYGWHAVGYLTVCLHKCCGCTDWDTMTCSDLDWRHLVGDPNPGTYKNGPERSAGPDDED